MAIVGAVAIALLGLALEAAVLVAVDAGSIELGTWWLSLVPVVGAVAAGVAVVVQRPASPDRRFLVGAAWLAGGIALHYGVGIDPAWRGGEVHGVAHTAWDLVFHLPPVLLGGWAVQHPMTPNPR